MNERRNERRSPCSNLHEGKHNKGSTVKICLFLLGDTLPSLLSQTPTHKSRMFSRFFRVLTERVRCEKMVLNETSSLTWRQFVWFMRLRCQERNNCLLIEPSAATLSA